MEARAHISARVMVLCVDNMSMYLLVFVENGCIRSSESAVLRDSFLKTCSVMTERLFRILANLLNERSGLYQIETVPNVRILQFSSAFSDVSDTCFIIGIATVRGEEEVSGASAL